MEKNSRFLDRFMTVTGKTAFFLGPASRLAMEAKGKHRLPSREEQEAIEYAEQTWEIHTTPEGEHYVVEKTAT